MESCPQNPSATKVSLGVFICLGLVAAWAPQISAVLKSKSSQGISIWYLLLGYMGSLATIANVILLQSDAVACCFTEWPLGYCLQDTLGITQTFIQTTFFLTFVTLVYSCIPDSARVMAIRLAMTKLAFGFLIFVSVSTLLVLKAMDVEGSQEVLEGWAGFLGVVAAVTGVFQFVPQVIHTIMTRDFGSLSVVSLGMMAPGSFVFAISLAMQPGTNWTSWISFAVCGVLQAFLILLWIYFHAFPEHKTEEQEELLQE
ncbi:hypothetical protein EDD86DRAFT_210883, partial [Gorgonomyces haynaldii]